MEFWKLIASSDPADALLRLEWERARLEQEQAFGMILLWIIVALLIILIGLTIYYFTFDKLPKYKAKKPSNLTKK